MRSCASARKPGNLVGIYAGEGASHSWTWFVTVMERLGSRAFSFLDEGSLGRGGLEGLSAVLIGGGDVEGMARALGEEGAAALKGFISGGGVYIGSCAGAYMVMRAVDLPPYGPFDLIDAGMANWLLDPPPPLQLPHKYKVAYGGGFVFHPAYGPVLVEMEEAVAADGPREVTAALYGGPVIVPGDGSEGLGIYRGMEKGCLPLVEEPLLGEMLTGTCAMARQGYGRGSVYICGPHFECPYFTRGAEVLRWVLEEENIYNMSDNCGGGASGGGPDPRAAGSLKAVKRELSNLRIVARGMETLPVRWNLGTKVWEPEKVAYYAEFLWERLPWLERCATGPEAAGRLEELAESAAAARAQARGLKRALDDGDQTDALAERLFRHLRLLTLALLETVRDLAPGYPATPGRAPASRM